MNSLQNTNSNMQGHAQKHGHYRVPISAFTVVIIVALLFGVLYMALPETLTIGPSWLPLVIECLLILPLLIARLLQHPLPYKVSRALTLILLGVMTLALVIGVILLIVTLPNRQTDQSGRLLHTGALLYAGNILVFGLLYWEIDGGGPKGRHEQNNQATDFMFPQQIDGNTKGWVPHMIDYLFLAFTGATAFSPTDTFPLTWRAKLLMMVEAVIALIVLSILIGRAVNIL